MEGALSSRGNATSLRDRIQEFQAKKISGCVAWVVLMRRHQSSPDTNKLLTMIPTRSLTHRDIRSSQARVGRQRTDHSDPPRGHGDKSESCRLFDVYALIQKMLTILISAPPSKRRRQRAATTRGARGVPSPRTHLLSERVAIATATLGIRSTAE